jgi:DNA-binding transcriptional regulator YiaG
MVCLIYHGVVLKYHYVVCLSIKIASAREGFMDSKQFRLLRQNLGKTQKEMSQLLGTSIKAIQSFEQGWRKIPTHIERQVLLLQALKLGGSQKGIPCWETRQCPPNTRQCCPAWEFDLGHLCWFINGTICSGKPLANWKKKMQICRGCAVFAASMGP